MGIREEKKQIIEMVLGRGKRQGGEYLYKCPNCNHHKNKLSVNYDKEFYKCWICGFRGRNLSKIVLLYGNNDLKVRWREIDVDGIEITDDYDEIRDKILDTIDRRKKDHVTTPAVDKEVQRQFEKTNYVSLANAVNPLISGASNLYLKNRGYDRYDILKWQIGFSIIGIYRHRIIIPSYNVNGAMNYFITRSYVDSEFKYWNPKVNKDDIIFNEFWIDWEDDIVLVEGVFDAMKIDKNAIPLLGSTLSEDSLLFKRIMQYRPNVILALDSDAIVKSKKIYDKLSSLGINVFRMSISGYNDVGEMPKEVVRRRIEGVMGDNELSYLQDIIIGL
jgi:DNA primase